MISVFRPNPAVALLKRELLTTLRRRRSYFAAFLVVMCVIVFFNIKWNGNIHYTMLGIQARDYLTLLIYFSMVVSMLIIPGMAAGTISLERERDTLDLLKTTLIPSTGLITGKLLNTVGFFLLLLCACLPAFAIVFFVVGVEIGNLLVSVCIVLLSSICLALVGMVASAMFRSVNAATVGSYIFAALFNFAPMLIFGLQAHIAGSFSIGFVMRSAWHYCPFGVLASSLSAGSQSVSWVPGLAYMAGIGALSLFVINRRLKKPERFVQRASGPTIDDQTILQERRKRFPYYVIDPLKRKDPIEDQRNPMMVKELRWGVAGKLQNMIRMSYLSLILFFVINVTTIYLTGFYPKNEAKCLLIETVILAAFLPILVINLFTKEFETDSIDSLKMTLLKPWDVVRGKFAAGFITVSPMVVTAILVPIPFFIFGSNVWTFYFAGIGLIMLTTIEVVCTGLFASVLARSTASAFLFNYLILLATQILPFLWWNLTTISSRGSREPSWIIPPFFMFSQAISEVFSRYGYRVRGRSFSADAFTWVSGAAFHCVIAFLFFFLAGYWFRTRVYDRKN